MQIDRAGGAMTMRMLYRFSKAYLYFSYQANRL
jgi:hypothetical protein